jgi:predicted RNase H-like HicB family nuclease
LYWRDLHSGRILPSMNRTEIIFTIEEDKEAGGFIAYWKNPKGGGITTQADSLEELPKNILEAMLCYFEGNHPKQVQIHFVRDPVLHLQAA